MDTPKPPLQSSSKALSSPSRIEPPAQPSLNDRLIAERVSTLLSHYWTAADPVEVRRAQIGDWLEDLAEFAAPVVSEAAKEWRQENTRRPSPGDIRLLCIAIKRRDAEKRRPVVKRISDMAREPIPPDDVIREHWRNIRFPLLTEAEKELFRAQPRRSIDEIAAMATRKMS